MTADFDIYRSANLLVKQHGKFHTHRLRLMRLAAILRQKMEELPCPFVIDRVHDLSLLSP